MYSTKLMNEFLEPKNYGVIKGASGVGKVVSDIGSEIVKIYIKVENETIVDCQFQTFGGVVAIALTSFATELLLGKTIKNARKIDMKDLSAKAGEIPEDKRYLLSVVTSAIYKALDNYENKSAVED